MDPYQFTKTINGEWTKATSGGNRNDRFDINPTYELTTYGEVLLELKAPKQFFIRIDVKGKDGWLPDQPYMQGYYMLKTKCNGSYKIVLSTFEVGMIGPFVLSIKSSGSITLTKK